MLENNNKTDYNQLIGFFLMGLILVGYMYWSSLNEPKIKAKKAEPIVIENLKNITTNSTNKENLIFSGKNKSTASKNSLSVIKNNKVVIKIGSKGGQIEEVLLKGFEGYNVNKDTGHVPLYLIKDKNSAFNLTFTDEKGNKINTSNLYFTQEQSGNNLKLTAKSANNGEIIFNYSLKNDYKLDFSISTKNLSTFSNKKNIPLSWNMNTLRQEKGDKWEKQYTEFYFSLNNYSDVDYENSDFTDKENSLDWVALKQQFFSSILLSDSGFKNIKAEVKEINIPEGTTSEFSKNFSFNSELNVKNGELHETLSWYFLPLDYKNLKSLNKDFEEIIPFGWGIFGFLNKYFFLPVFKFLSTLGWSYGWVILLLTIVVKLITSPIMYKQFKQSAIMRVLRPEIDEINEKFKDKDPIKKQQATMELYNKTGVNMLAGCIPALLQIPIFYALFNFFPNMIDLRRVGFLWAEDLTAYDTVFNWSQNIPFISSFYGNHISLLAILYAIVLLIYTKMSSGNMPPAQEGMPDMKVLTYVMPLIFVVFLNSYASGLSWYYLVSNIINIILILVIKYFFIDEAKIHAQLQENKKKPKKESKFQQRLKLAMDKAQEQKKEIKK